MLNFVEMPKMKLVDFTSTASLYHSEELVENASVCKGYVTATDDGGTERIVFKGYPSCVKLTEKTVVRANLDASKCRWFYSVEGTLVRVFKIKGKWFASTSRKLDATKSRWAAKTDTFGDRFLRLLRSSVGFECDCRDDRRWFESFCESRLDEKKKYAFVVAAGEEERIVCDSVNVVFHVGTFDENDVLGFDDVVEGVDRLAPMAFATANDLLECVGEKDLYKRYQGVIGFHENGSVYKVLSERYAELANVRGNVPSLRFRYLMLRRETNPNVLADFFELYPSMRRRADLIESRIYELCKRLHALYVRIYIQKDEDVYLYSEEKSMLTVVHATYRKDYVRTTPSKINDILFASHPSRLNKLLKIMIN